MARYVLCPRCELNFIDADAQEYCDVCLKEMQGAKTFADDLEEVEETEEMELCPICGENYMRIGEKMCDECKKKTEYEEEEIEDPDKDDAWRTYLDDDADDLGIPLPRKNLTTRTKRTIWRKTRKERARKKTISNTFLPTTIIPTTRRKTRTTKRTRLTTTRLLLRRREKETCPRR